MKQGDEASRQFEELAIALREIGAGWVVDEVVETAARGKTVLLSSLPEEQLSVFRDKLSVEDRKGLPVGRIGKADEAIVPFSEAERLAMLIDAADRVVTATADAHAYVVDFAESEGIASIRFEPPEDQDDAATEGARWSIPLDPPIDLEDRLQRVHVVLGEASE